jgi:poly(A) polymerase
MATLQPPDLAGQHWLREPRLQRVLEMLNENGGEARIAGGAVRNALLRVPVADVDIATTLQPQEVVRRAVAVGFAAHPTGIDHGTVTIVHHHMPFEITTLRRDVTTDGRRATVAFTTDWAEDAARRDFTINAMYCDASGKIYDFTDGYKDVLKRRVRFVGLPSRRIREDFLRILRFFRFHAHFGRGAIDTQGLAACARLRRGIAGLSAERIRQELFKLLVAPRAIETLKSMAEVRVLPFVLPYEPHWRVLQRLPADAVLRLAALAASPGEMQEHLRLSNGDARRLQAISEAPAITPDFRPAERRRVLYHLGAPAFADAVRLTWARSRARLDDPGWRGLFALAADWPVPKFPVSGKDLASIGLAPGPSMGETLRALEDWWIASDFKPTREALLARAKPRT